MSDIVTPALIAAAAGAVLTLLVVACGIWLSHRARRDQDRDYWFDEPGEFHDGHSDERHGPDTPRRPGPAPDGDVYFTSRPGEPLRVMRRPERREGGGE